MTLEQRFEPIAESVPLARRFVIEAIGEMPERTRNAIAVMTSELASNAVLHARTEFYVSVDIEEASVRVEVRDLGEGFPEPRIPPPDSDPHGRGLFIVKRFAEEWGITESRASLGKSVWFRMMRDQPALVNR